MFEKARAKHFAFIRGLIVQGAQDGAFSAKLAEPEAELNFFRPLAEGLDSGYITLNGHEMPLYVYVYFNPAKDKVWPLGFVMFKGGNSMMEFWMAGIETAFRKQGLGELMFTEALRSVGAKTC